MPAVTCSVEPQASLSNTSSSVPVRVHEPGVLNHDGKGLGVVIADDEVLPAVRLRPPFIFPSV